jgi:large subunit ribosomal protein L3
MTGILGKKLGMTQVFTEDGKMVCVTVIEAGPCPVLAVRGANIQLGFDAVKKEERLKKPILGIFKKAGVSGRKVIKELLKDPAKEYKVGEEIKVDLFKAGDFVDVTGTSLGKGFQGGMKRWNWQGGPQTHGSTSHRRVGSMGSGNCTVTIQNLKVAKVDLENNLLLIEGAVPGHKNSYLVVRIAKKKGQAKKKGAAVKK